MFTLYSMQRSGNSYKARLALAQLRVPYRLVEIDILKGESHTPEFLAKNPNGQVPLLEVAPGRYLAESNAILWYIAGGSALAPEDRQLIHHQAKKCQSNRRVQAEKQRIVLGEERRVGRRRGEQEQQDAAERRAGDENVGHRASCTGASGVKGNRFQSDASVHSRLVTALTRNGVGSWAGSRRSRTAAT